jgi:sulfide:quinone oxidoreductase
MKAHHIILIIGGASQKIIHLAEEWLRGDGLRRQSKVIFINALANLFTVDNERKTLEKHVAYLGIKPI